jgi:putative ABC transport system permease protein
MVTVPMMRRSNRLWDLLHSVTSDIRYAVRSFRRSPGVVIVAAISLGLGIGANVSVFSLADVYLFRQLPYPEADRLVRVYKNMPERGFDYNEVSIPDFLDFRDASRTLEIAASYPRDLNLSGTDRPERVEGELTSWDYFQVLRVQPVLGRAFIPEEEIEGRHRVAVISDGLWRRRFGSDPSVVGRTIRLDAVPFTVVGVLPPGFRFGLDYTDVWTPFGLTGNEGRNTNVLGPIGRLRAGATLEAANAELSAIAERLARAYPESHAGWSAGARDLLLDFTPEEARLGLVILWVAVAFVLLIVCANVANLMLARAAGHMRETAVRGALGASRGRIVRQLLTEAMVISAIGGVLGIFLSVAGIRAIVAILPDWIPRLQEMGLDGRVLLYGLVATTVTGIVFGTTPALQSSKADFLQSLKEGGRGVLGSRSGGLRKALAVSQVTLALTLLVGSALLIKGFFRLQAADPGWAGENVLTFRFRLPASEYPGGESVSGFYNSLLPRLEALPGVESVGGISILPMSRSNTNTFYDVVAQEAADPTHRPLAEFRFIVPGYFETMDIATLQGRSFDDRDGIDARPVVIVNEMLAERHWADEDAIGKRVDLWDATREIIGVVENTLDVERTPRPMLYLSAVQYPRTGMGVVLRTSGDPTSLIGAVRAELSALDPDLPLYAVMSMHTLASRGRQLDAVMAQMMAAMAAVALVLSVIGVYGVISYSVSQRTREIGIRMALGAREGSVLRMVLRQGAMLTGIGVTAGIVSALLVARTLSLFLFGVSPFDLVAFATATALLVCCSLLACYFPARRVAKLDPLEVLKYE